MVDTFQRASGQGNSSKAHYPAVALVAFGGALSNGPSISRCEPAVDAKQSGSLPTRWTKPDNAMNGSVTRNGEVSPTH